MSGAKILSQEDVDALLKSMGGGEVEKSGARMPSQEEVDDMLRHLRVGDSETDRFGRVEPKTEEPRPAEGGLESIIRKAAEVLTMDGVASVSLGLVMDGKKINCRICRR